MSDLSDSVFLGRLELPVSPFMAGSVVEYAGHIAQLLSFDETETLGVKLAVEEAYDNAVDLFPGKTSETERIRVEFRVEKSSLVISVKDKGIPFDQEQAKRFSADAPDDGKILAIHKFMDSVELIDHGRDGREVRLAKRCRSALPAELAGGAPVERQRRTTVAEPLIRLARRAEDMIEVCRLAWRCYGFTHEEILYDPKAMAEMIAEGRLDSVIAVDPVGGSILGHICLKHHVPGDRVPEIGLAFVDPAYRSPGLPGKMARRLFDKARADGARGIFDCSVTTHTHSQKGMHDMGSRPCCLMLGITPSGMQARELATSQQAKGSTVNHYFAFDRSPGTIFIPERHQAMVREIYGWLEVPRTFGEPDAATPSGESSVSVFRLPDALNVAFLVVHAIGADTEAEIADGLKQCRREHKDAVYAFIPSNVGTAPRLVEQCERMGFFFSGIMPHIHDGKDRILMQFPDIPLDFDAIRVYGRMAGKLFDYIQGEHQRTLALR